MADVCVNCFTRAYLMLEGQPQAPVASRFSSWSALSPPSGAGKAPSGLWPRFSAESSASLPIVSGTPDRRLKDASRNLHATSRVHAVQLHRLCSHADLLLPVPTLAPAGEGKGAAAYLRLVRAPMADGSASSRHAARLSLLIAPSWNSAAGTSLNLLHQMRCIQCA